jgi:site-specific DNA recombinase
LKVAIYARYSSDNQRDASIADQLRVCREFAVRQGWMVVQEFRTPDGAAATGAREIVPAEAEVIRRIFRDYAAGLSPKAIAKRLNAERCMVPGGALWNPSTIHGNPARGTGILNNEL